jgi:hypothetical protein
MPSNKGRPTPISEISKYEEARIEMQEMLPIAVT